MPMIDVYAANDMFPKGSERELGESLTLALLRAEGVPNPGPIHLNNTGAYLHRMSSQDVQTAASPLARTVRVQIVTPPSVLSRDGQRQLVKEVTEIITKVTGDPSQATRTFVLLTEAAEGGWGIAGIAFGHEEFAALAQR
jgi:phenylpyruvate tautomerase PptA (4-oxalocrotonate tautomerase family)